MTPKLRPQNVMRFPACSMVYDTNGKRLAITAFLRKAPSAHMRHFGESLLREMASHTHNAGKS